MAVNLVDYWLNLKYRIAQIPNYSTISLLVFNAIPLFGVLFWKWDVGLVMGLYWFENVVIGFFNVLRILWAGYFGKENFLASLSLVPFFVLHYGSFTFIHGFFIWHLFIRESGFGGSEGLGPMALITPGLALTMMISFISHGISFAVNFVGRREYENIELQKLMTAPYKRIIILQITVILGAYVLLATNSPVQVISILVILKIAFDLHAHLKEHITMQRLAQVQKNGNSDFYDDLRHSKKQNPDIRYK
ncbi:MAG: DUF6498-containing protein [Candidatus Zixiibacteriota bacterium]